MPPDGLCGRVFECVRGCLCTCYFVVWLTTFCLFGEIDDAR